MRRVPAVAFALLLLGVAGDAQQTTTFSSKVESVRVDVLVSDNGQAVRGLGPERLREQSPYLQLRVR